MDDTGCDVEGAWIAHWTPGRVRISFPDNVAAEQFAKTVVEIPGVRSAKANPLTGSVLVHYTEAPEGSRAEPYRPHLETPRSAARPQREPTSPTVGPKDVVRSLLRLVGAILAGDVIGIVAWLLFDVVDKSAPLPRAASMRLAA